ncbi:hypothetical protein JCM24511_02396 [Saitozyma sp. JCM 24511]|nr:hypothetical protein JCM24511_02396 [Saitozyma sp. JCM 24511]
MSEPWRNDSGSAETTERTPLLATSISRSDLSSNVGRSADDTRLTQFSWTFSDTQNGLGRVVGTPVKMDFLPHDEFVWKNSPVIADDLRKGIESLAWQWENLLIRTELNIYGGTDEGAGETKIHWSEAVGHAIKLGKHKVTRELEDKVAGCCPRSALTTEENENQAHLPSESESSESSQKVITFMGYTETELQALAKGKSLSLAPYAEVTMTTSQAGGDRSDANVKSIVVGTVAVASTDAHQAIWNASADRVTKMGDCILGRSSAGMIKDTVLMSLSDSARWLGKQLEGD